MTRLRVFLLGVRTWRDCAEGGSGYSGFDNPDHDNVYDQGVNLGQNLDLLLQVLRRPLAQHVAD